MGQNQWISGTGTSDLVTVIIPLYKSASHILETIESVRASSHRPIELILVNDQSPDDTEDVVLRWINRLPPDDRFTICYLRQKNAGASASRNNALIRSSGEFIHFLDHDDMVTPKLYEHCVRAFREQPKIGLVWAGWKMAESSEMQSTVNWCMDYDARYGPGIPETNTPPLFCAGLFRRGTLAQVGPLATTFFPGEDFNYFLRLRVLGVPILRLQSTLMVYRLHGAQNSRKRDHNAMDSIIKAVEHAEEIKNTMTANAENSFAIRRIFANAFKTAVLYTLSARYADLTYRAGQGFARYRSGLPLRHRIQMQILVWLGSLGQFDFALAVGRFFYGAGSFESLPKISK